MYLALNVIDIYHVKHMLDCVLIFFILQSIFEIRKTSRHDITIALVCHFLPSLEVKTAL